MTPNKSRAGFLLMEMMASLALAAMLVGVFYSAMHRVRELEAMALAQGRALIVLENVVERLGAEPEAGRLRAGEILDEEFRASALHIADRFSARCEELQPGFRLLIVRESGTPVAAVEVIR
jgi:type II secretory pathway component PulJ